MSFRHPQPPPHPNKSVSFIFAEREDVCGGGQQYFFFQGSEVVKIGQLNFVIVIRHRGGGGGRRGHYIHPGQTRTHTPTQRSSLFNMPVPPLLAGPGAFAGSLCDCRGMSCFIFTRVEWGTASYHPLVFKNSHPRPQTKKD